MINDDNSNKVIGERGSAPKGGRRSSISSKSSVRALPVRCPSAQWQPDGLTTHTNKWFLGARLDS